MDASSIHPIFTHTYKWHFFPWFLSNVFYFDLCLNIFRFVCFMICQNSHRLTQNKYIHCFFSVSVIKSLSNLISLPQSSLVSKRWFSQDLNFLFYLNFWFDFWFGFAFHVIEQQSRKASSMWTHIVHTNFFLFCFSSVINTLNLR